jgi:hypothetical protein
MDQVIFDLQYKENLQTSLKLDLEICDDGINTTIVFLDIIHRPVFITSSCASIRTSSINWAQLSKFHLKTETEPSLRNDE